MAPGPNAFTSDTIGAYLTDVQEASAAQWSLVSGRIVFAAGECLPPPCIGCQPECYGILRTIDPATGKTDILVPTEVRNWFLSSDGRYCWYEQARGMYRVELLQRGNRTLELVGSTVSAGDTLVAWYVRGDCPSINACADDSVFVMRRGAPESARYLGRGRPLRFSPDARELLVSRLGPSLEPEEWLVQAASGAATQLESISGTMLVGRAWDGNGLRNVRLDPGTGQVLVHRAGQLTAVPVATLPATGWRDPRPLGWSPAIDRIAFAVWRPDSSVAPPRRRDALWIVDLGRGQASLLAEGLFTIQGGDLAHDGRALAAVVERRLYLFRLP